MRKKRQYHKSQHGKLIRKFNDFKRISKLRNSKFKLNKEDMQKILKRDKVCIYCGSDENLGLDHLNPVSKYGKTEINNIVLACLSCNSSKYNHNVIDWCKQKGIEGLEIVVELIQ